MKSKEMNKINRRIQEFNDKFQVLVNQNPYTSPAMENARNRQRNQDKRLARKLRGK